MVSTKIRKNEHDEYVVKLYINGRHVKDADYFTNDRHDAEVTAMDMRKRAFTPTRICEVCRTDRFKPTRPIHVYERFDKTVMVSVCEQCYPDCSKL